MAYAMVAYFGMSPKLGNRSFFDSSGQSEYSFTKPYSDKTAELIDQEVNELISSAYNRAKEILKKYTKGLNQLANLLLEKEVIFSEDLEKIFGHRKYPVTEYYKSKISSEKNSGETDIKPVTKVKKPRERKSEA